MSGQIDPRQSAAGRRGMESRWAAHREARLAAGLPATVREEQGRKPDRFSDPDVEAVWLERADAADVIPEGSTSTQRRRIAFRYAQAVTAQTSQRAAQKLTTPPTSTEERLAYYEAEIVRLTAAERVARRHADEHQRQREQAEAIVADIVFREGRA
ncbi:hypothetical protein [Microbacterium sp. BH-3-3-3]|uniref:hypothetical protein n=1 Tax=Microbacterium sp. BH-3-3-3 TaxID=1906742 RepID=UPI0011A78C6B|nr:hypothetical protein [Microbacterium sp. BH-3-3-3]